MWQRVKFYYSKWQSNEVSTETTNQLTTPASLTVFHPENQHGTELDQGTSGKNVQFWSVFHIEHILILISCSYRTHLDQVSICIYVYTQKHKYEKTLQLQTNGIHHNLRFSIEIPMIVVTIPNKLGSIWKTDQDISYIKSIMIMQPIVRYNRLLQ
jgi:hypothetical protein